MLQGWVQVSREARGNGTEVLTFRCVSATSIDRSVPKPVHRVPNKMIVRNQVREASVRTLLVFDPAKHDLVIEPSVQEVGPDNRRMTREVSGSGVSQSPLVTIETIVGEEDRFFPTGLSLWIYGWKELETAMWGRGTWLGTGRVWMRPKRRAPSVGDRRGIANIV